MGKSALKPPIPDGRPKTQGERPSPLQPSGSTWGSADVSTTAATPLGVLFRPQAIIATILVGEAFAVVLALSPAHSPDRLVHFGLASLAIQWVAMGTLAVLHVLRKHLARLPAARLAWVALGSFISISVLVAWGAVLLAELAVPLPEARTSFLLRWGCIALVVGLLALLTYRNYWNARQLAVRTKQLELESLRARIRPHFLFNTLNTSAALVHARPDEAERVLLDLADLFRAALRGPERVPLAKEVELTRRYLEIESFRFGPRLRVAWSLPDPLPDANVPALSLQPLAENAIRHGIEHMPGGGNIDIRLRHASGWITIEVENDMPADGNRATDGHRIGLNSARERVRALSAGRLVNGRHLARLTIPEDVPAA